MRWFISVLVEIVALVAASPVSLDQLFASDFNDLGTSPFTESLFDPFYSDINDLGSPPFTESQFDPLYSDAMMNTNDIFSSPVSSNPSDSLFFTETTPGDMAAMVSNPATIMPSESPDLLFDQDEYPFISDDLFGQFSQGEPDSDCIPDLMMRGIGKIRLGRSCSELKEEKKSSLKTCVKERSQLCCCSTRGIDGVYNLGCKGSTRTAFSIFYPSAAKLRRIMYALTCTSSMESIHFTYST